MAQAALRKKAMRLLLRAKVAERDTSYAEAIIKLGWDKPLEPSDAGIETLLEKAQNSVVEQIIESLKRFQGEAQTKSPRLVAFQEYWQKQLELQSAEAAPKYLDAAFAAIQYDKIGRIAYGEPGDLDCRATMYLYLAKQRDFDPAAATVSGLTLAEFDKHLKAALDDEHRRRVLRTMVELTPSTASSDVLDIRVQMLEYLRDNYTEGLHALLEWAERKRKQTQFHNPNWTFRFLREMELMRIMLAQDPKEIAAASERFDMWQRSIQMVRSARFFLYGQIVS